MKKQHSFKIVSVILAVVLALGSFSVCAFGEESVCTEHSFDDGTVIKEATCTETGTVLYSCVNCDYSKKEVVVPEGHFYSYDYLEETYIASTCVSEGYEHYVLTCPKCEEVIIDLEYVLTEKKHDWVDVKVLQQADCLVPGYKLVKCSLCGVEETVIIHPNQNHSGKEGTQHPVTCTENGIINFGNCYVCGESIPLVIEPATGHSKDNYRLIKEPTCTEPGLAYYDCTHINYYGPCGFVGEEEIPALGHDYVETCSYVPADCGVQGVEPGLACTRCGDVLIEATYPEYFDHDFKIDILSAADAQNNGKALYTCQNETDTSWVHIFELEFSLSDVVPEASEDGRFVIDADKAGIVGNIRDITGIYEENVSFTVEDTDGITINENGNIVADNSGVMTVLVTTPANAARIEVEVRLFDSLEIAAEDTLETGAVLDIEVFKQPFGVKADDVIWTSSDESIVFVSDGRLVAIGTGTVTLTATSGNLTVSKEITFVSSGETRDIRFVAIDKMHYIVEDYYGVFNGDTLYWSDSASIRFKVRTYGTFPFEAYIVYINGAEAEADANGYFTVPADSGSTKVTITGAMYESGAEEGEKVSFWQAIINFFNKIIAFFQNLGK